MSGENREVDRRYRSALQRLAHDMDLFFNESFERVNTLFNIRSFPVYVEETDQDIIVTADLPGIKRNQISIECFGNRLYISVQENQTVEAEDKRNNSFHHHRSYQQMERILSMPFEIPEAETNATFKNGQLILTIPKQNSKRKFIDIDP